jgi:hypothetical protein
VLCGSGPEAERAQALAASLDVGDRIELAGPRDAAELAEVYRRTHVVLVPSRPTSTWTEQFGRVIVEAHASGALVAGYATGSIPEVAGDAALLVAAGDVERLAERVLGVLGDPAQWDERRSKGLSLAAERTWARVAEGQVALYRAAIDGATRLQLPRSPRRRRAAARAELGPTAATTAGLRPFALPALRRGGVLANGLAAVCDLGAETAAAVQRLAGASSS